MTPVNAPTTAPPAGRAGLPSEPAATSTDERRRRRTRGLVIITVTVLLLVALMTVRVLVGTPMVYADHALRAILGEQLPGISYIVVESRLPAAIIAVLAGIAFGLSGTTFQTLLRNPLASPDVIGVSLGASAGAVIAMALFGAQGTTLFWFTLLGGTGIAALVLLVAGAARTGTGGAVDNRFVLVGIGVAAALQALISYLMTRVNSQTAGDIMHWLIGSLSTSTWDRVRVLALALVVLVPILAALLTRLRILQLGDDTATSLGLAVPRTRIALVLVAVALTSLTVAVTGPLAFVAFLSGPLARIIAGRPSVPLAAGIGALIVLAADIIGQNAFGAVDLPAGVITGVLGAPFLLWLLTRSPSPGEGK